MVRSGRKDFRYERVNFGDDSDEEDLVSHQHGVLQLQKAKELLESKLQKCTQVKDVLVFLPLPAGPGARTSFWRRRRQGPDALRRADPPRLPHRLGATGHGGLHRRGAPGHVGGEAARGRIPGQHGVRRSQVQRHRTGCGGQFDRLRSSGREQHRHGRGRGRGGQRYFRQWHRPSAGRRWRRRRR